jgi:hypothetical protein
MDDTTISYVEREWKEAIINLKYYIVIFLEGLQNTTAILKITGLQIEI